MPISERVSSLKTFAINARCIFPYDGKAPSPEPFPWPKLAVDAQTCPEFHRSVTALRTVMALACSSSMAIDPVNLLLSNS